MSKYNCGPGSNLDMLAEECAEIIQAICKAKRFGLEGNKLHQQETKLSTPQEYIIQEVGDLLSVIERMLNSGELPWRKLDDAKHRKHNKIRTLFEDHLMMGDVTLLTVTAGVVSYDEETK